MLTDEQKQQISLEEIYREEVRKSLSPEKTRKGKIIAFFNSPLGLWILSSILLAAITTAWAAWSTGRDKERATDDRISKMKTEIRYRLSQVEGDLGQFVNGEIRYFDAATAPLTVPLSPDKVIGPAAFPEFNNRTVKSLLIEWQAISSGAEHADAVELQKIIDDLLKLGPAKNASASTGPIGSERELTLEERSSLVRQAEVLIDRAKPLLGG